MISIPLVVLLALGGGAALVAHERRRGMTPNRAIVYETALRVVKDPKKLRDLAAVFRQEGLTAQADMLEKRAKLRELPEAQKEARRDALRKGMTSQDPAAVENLAAAFESEGATGAADKLKLYAKGLREAAKAPPAVPTPASAPVSLSPAPAKTE